MLGDTLHKFSRQDHLTPGFGAPLRYGKHRVSEFYIHGSVHRESNFITVQQDATYSVYSISVGSSTCSGC